MTRNCDRTNETELEMSDAWGGVGGVADSGSDVRLAGQEAARSDQLKKNNHSDKQNMGQRPNKNGRE